MVRYILVAIPVTAGALLVLFLGTGNDTENDRVFHVILADPDLYVNGIYSGSFLAEPGEYMVWFVPNGDSPPTLTLSVEGLDTYFAAEYALQGTLHETGISEYYTWEYLGPNRLVVVDSQQLTVTVDPHGSTTGSVSVSLIRDGNS